MFLGKPYWAAYNWTALAIIMGGLTVVVAKTFRYARKFA